MNNIEPLKSSAFQIGLSNEELYLKLWEREQEHTKNRWNVTTFFFSISFAIFGFSLPTKNLPVSPIISHSVALAIY